MTQAIMVDIIMSGVGNAIIMIALMLQGWKPLNAFIACVGLMILMYGVAGRVVDYAATGH